MPTLVTLTTLAGRVTRLIARTLQEDGWTEFAGPVQLRFVHTAVRNEREAKARLYSIRLDPQLFLIENHSDDEWAEAPVAAPPHLRADGTLGGKANGAVVTVAVANCTRWAAEEDALLLDCSNAEVARRTGRTISAVKARRSLLRCRRPSG